MRMDISLCRRRKASAVASRNEVRMGQPNLKRFRSSAATLGGAGSIGGELATRLGSVVRPLSVGSLSGLGGFGLRHLGHSRPLCGQACCPARCECFIRPQRGRDWGIYGLSVNLRIWASGRRVAGLKRWIDWGPLCGISRPLGGTGGVCA